MAKNDQTLHTKPENLAVLPLTIIIKAYQKFASPLLGPNCRFHPSCSCYAQQALDEHGVLIGSWLSIKRIVKCNPLHPGGFDYVPKKQSQLK